MDAPSPRAASSAAPSEAHAELLACLPATLRGANTTIARVATGWSGAKVYRVEAGPENFALKIAPAATPLADWRAKLDLQQRAAYADLAPRVVHIDEERRAVVSAFVADRSFPLFYRDPRTHEAALTQLGQTFRRLHALPLPRDSASANSEKDPRAQLAATWSELAENFPLPTFVGATLPRLLALAPPPRDRAPVLSHNDANPSNLAYDGTRIVLLDWDAAGPNDPFFDLATLAVFLRMDDPTCEKLFAAYDGAPIAPLPPSFVYNRRWVAAFCGVTFLHLARRHGHAGARGDETLETTLSLGDFYQRLRTGALNPATPEGQWHFGLALLKTSTGL